MVLSIITGTFNRLPYLQAMFASAIKSMPPHLEHEFVVCDGGSTDGTLEWLREQPNTRVIEHGELRGAIAAFNDAGAAARGDYLVVANDDVEFIGFTIAKGLAFIMDNPDCGAALFYQNRGGKDMHVEKMPVIDRDDTEKMLPYLQVGIVPRWLWKKCEGWGNWGGRTYGGDNFLSGRIYQSGYRLVPVEGCGIRDATPKDALRAKNEAENNSTLVWEQFPDGIRVPPAPIYRNPLPERKRVLYAPIIEAGHTQAKLQKRGLRDALGAMGVVWEVDYIYSGESVVAAAEAWRPHLVLTQFHTKGNTSVDEVRRIREAAQGPLINWSGDVWNDQSTPEMMEILRFYDYHLTVNAALLPEYHALGIRAAYWQNSAEAQIHESDETHGQADVVFVGNNYGEYRIILAQSLKALPFDVKIYGNGYPEGLSEGESLYDFRKTGRIYRGAKIALGDNQYLSATGFCSDRLFMILAAGGCLLMHQRVNKLDELLGLKEGVHYIAWDQIADLEEKIRYYLEHEDERLAIAEAGTKECRENQTYAKRVEQLRGLIANLPKKQRTLSVCMVVRNALEDVGELLPTLSFADQIVIVETEPNQVRAMSNAQGYGGHLRPQDEAFLFPWTDSFSEARNFAKSKCTGDFILWIDADERLPEETQKHLDRFKEWSFRHMGIQMPQAFKFRVVNYRDGIREPQTAMQLRLFQNIQKVEWGNRIHEHDNLEGTARAVGLSFLSLSNMEIHHHVPASKEAIWAKEERNLRLLRMESPSPWRDTYIGVSEAALENWGAAIVWFSIASKGVEDPDTRAYLSFNIAYCYYKLGQEEEARAHLKKCDFLDAKYLLAELTPKSEPFPARLLREFIDGEIPSNFPTFAVEWKKQARTRLMRWHHAEMVALAEPAGRSA